MWISCLAVFTLFETITSQTRQTGCQDVHSVSGYSLTRHTYQMTSGVRLITCIATCQDDPDCYSLNFKFTPKLCELNNATRLSVEPKYFVSSGETVYLDNLYRPYRPCDNVPCKNGGTCVVINFYPGFKCECKSDYTGQTCEGRTNARVLIHFTTLTKTCLTKTKLSVSVSCSQQNVHEVIWYVAWRNTTH